MGGAPVPSRAAKNFQYGGELGAEASKEKRLRAITKQGLRPEVKKRTKEILNAWVKSKNAFLHQLAETNNMTGMPIRFVVSPSLRIDIVIDEDFFQRVFARKVYFSAWLKEEYEAENISKEEMYNMIDESYKEQHGRWGGKEHTANYKKFQKMFNRKIGTGDLSGKKAKEKIRQIRQSMKNSQMHSLQRISFLGKQNSKSSSEGFSRFEYKGNVENAVTDWIANEPKIFGGNLVFGAYGEKNKKAFKAMLSETARELQELFVRIQKEGGFPKITESGISEDSFQMPEKFDEKSFSKAMTHINLPKKSTPKFPNIDRIRDWYLKHDKLFNSHNQEKYYNATPKGKMNFIDSAIFLIGLNMFEKRGGKRSQLRGYNKTARYEGGKKSYTNKPAMKRARKGRGTKRSEQRQNFRKPFSHRTSFRTRAERKRNT